MMPHCSKEFRTHRDRDGFALVAVLMVLLGVSALAAAGFLAANTDYRINQSHRAAQKAFYVADAGLDHYLGYGKMRSDTTTYNHADGTALVWADSLMVVDDSSTLYRVTSRATHDAPEGGTATREFSTVVLHKAVGLGANAAITAPAGLVKNGAAGDVDGHDYASSTDCSVGGQEDVAGVMVPPGGFTQNGGGGGGPTGFDGNPPIDDTQTAVQILHDLGIDASLWQGIQDGSFAQADYVVSSDGYPNFSTDVESDEWPLIVADYSSFSATPDESGRGTLVVQGDLEIDGAFSWDGLVLVGGQITSNGNNHISGSIVAGLNILLGDSPAAVDLGNGTWQYNYHSCNVMNALKGIGWPVEEPSTWFEDM